MKVIKWIAYMLMLVIIVSNLSSCNHDEDNTKELKLYKKIKCSNELSETGSILPLNDTCFIAISSGTSPFITIINRFDGKILNQFGHLGNDQNALVWPRPIKNDCNDYPYTMIDMTLGKFVHLYKDSVVDWNNKLKCELAESCIFVNDSITILSYLGTDTRFKLFKNDGEIEKEINIDYPVTEKISKAQASMVCQGHLLKRPKSNQFVHFSRYGKMLEFFSFDFDNMGIKRDTLINKIQPKFKKNNNNTQEISGNLVPKNKIGYISGFPTKEYLYLLYSGKEMSDPSKLQTNIIEQYDWEGNIINRFKLDNEILDFFIDGQSIISLGKKTEGYYIYIYEIV
jgi:hypothetical protein